eukprot:Hpha_TRINITY_DN6824_c0_g1::TRINITY_DN6824_c0_g1_i1::g.46187::m.46187
MQRELPNRGGTLEVVRTPDSVSVLRRLKEDWPLRVGFAGALPGVEVQQWPVDDRDGKWSLPRDMRQGWNEQAGLANLPYVPMALLKMPSGRRTIRKRRQLKVERPAYAVQQWVQKLTAEEEKRLEEQWDLHVRPIIRAHFTTVRPSFAFDNLRGNQSFPPGFCQRIFDQPVHLLYELSNRNMVHVNLWHWYLEALLPVYHARVARGERVMLSVAGNWRAYFAPLESAPELRRVFQEMLGGSGELIFRPWDCLRQARLEAVPRHPGPGVDRGLAPLLRSRLGLPSRPLPTREGERLSVALLRRLPGGTRAVVGVPGLVKVAQEL